MIFFFFKQKTAYEMRVSDWSSDVCSSDLGQDRDGLSRRWPARFRTDLGREYRADAGGEEIRTRSRIPPRHLCDVVDPRLDPGIHPALVEPRQDGPHRRAEEAVLQPAPDEGQDRKSVV